MDRNSANSLNNFTIFGFTRKPEVLIRQKLAERLGIVPKIVDFGNAGSLFFYSSHGELAETESAIVLKLGFVRSPTKSPLSATQLLEQKIITPLEVKSEALRGNALVICFSKTDARFIAFKNLVSLPQLYYRSSKDEWIGANNLRCLVNMLDQVVLNEDIAPYHFMFRHAPGTLTYFQDIHRLFPGQVLKWQEGKFRVYSVQDFRYPQNIPVFERRNSRSLAALYQELKDVMGAYITDIQKSGGNYANLLSGGVDSSLLQIIINEYNATGLPTQSFSFAPTHTPSFTIEKEYAKYASKVFETEHSFAEFSADEYPNLVIRAIEILGQPVLSYVEPCKLALAEYLSKYAKDIGYFFVGQGADTLFGLGVSRKIKMLELVGKVPGARLTLTGMGNLLRPFANKSQLLLKGADILFHSFDPQFFLTPINTIAVYTNLDMVSRTFGEKSVRQVLAYRREWEEKYLNSKHQIEKVHVIDLLSDTYEIEVQSGQLFLANNKEQIYPFMDDDTVRLSFAFQPQIRYITGFRSKPLLKNILEQRGQSTIARRPKGGSGFHEDFYAWLGSGPLNELVHEIDRPGFLSKTDFEQSTKSPSFFLWSLLTFDIFKKKFLKG